MTDDLAYYMRRIKELEQKVENLIKEKALLEEKNKRVGRCIHSNCSICVREEMNWI
jgi:cell division protein FtsB